MNACNCLESLGKEIETRRRRRKNAENGTEKEKEISLRQGIHLTKG